MFYLRANLGMGVILPKDFIDKSLIKSDDLDNHE